MMKSLFVLPFTLAILAGCAGSSDTQTQSPQASADCSSLSGAALLECQNNVQPAAQMYKSSKPKTMIHGPGGDAGSTSGAR